MSTQRIVPLNLPGPTVDVESIAVTFPRTGLPITWAAARFRVVEPTGEAALGDSELARYSVPSSLQGAAPRRLTTFLAGRAVASQALRAAGCDAWSMSVERTSVGAPVWPTGWLGSIAHTDTLSVSAVGVSHQVSLLGVDCESIMSKKIVEEVGKMVAPELVLRPSLRGGMPEELAYTVAFSVKEALYKALYPVVGAYFGFEAAELISIDRAGGVVRLRLTQGLTNGLPAGREFEGRWVVADDHVIAVVAIAA